MLIFVPNLKFTVIRSKNVNLDLSFKPFISKLESLYLQNSLHKVDQKYKARKVQIQTFIFFPKLRKIQGLNSQNFLRQMCKLKALIS